MKYVHYAKRIILPAIFCFFFVISVLICLSVALKDGMGIDSPLVNYMTKHVTIQAGMIDDKWEKEYPFEGFDRYTNRIYELENQIEAICTTSMLGSESIEKCMNFFKNNIYHYNINSVPGGYENAAYGHKYAKNVVDFAEVMNERGYKCMYVASASMLTQKYRSDKRNELKETKVPERRENFVSDIKASGIDVLDLADVCLEDMSYDDSGHWMQGSALEGTTIVLDKLNRDYGFDFDLSLYNPDNYTDIIDKRDGLADEIFEKYGYDYDILIPEDSYDITLKYADEPAVSGDFEDVLIVPKESWNEWGEPYHNSLRINNSLFYDLKNSSPANNVGKSILIIGDSFDWPVCNYIVQDISEVIFLHNISFNGSVLSFIDNISPDMVIVMYGDAVFYDIYTEAAYNLK